MSNYLREATRPTPQSEPLDERQVQNEAGGYAYEADPLDRLRRFLILGTEGGSYYASEQEMTRKQVENLRRVVREAGPDAVLTIEAVSRGGLAPKNDPALFALAVASVDGDEKTRKAAYEALPFVARIGTHLFHWCAFRDALGGWGRGATRAVARWYEDKDPEELALQMVKYRQRDGWTHRDCLRLAHGHGTKADEAHARLYDFACGRVTANPDDLPPIVTGYQYAQAEKAAKGTAGLIERFKLPREAVNTDHLNEPEVWNALLRSGEGMPMTAMIRNLGNMSRVGLLTPGSEAAKFVCDRLGNTELLQRARVHPIQVLAAHVTYAQGHGARGRGEWNPVTQVVDALDAAFYATFGNVQPANARTCLALDVSGSMDWGEVSGIPGLTPRVGSAAMALVTMATEPAYEVVAFATTLQTVPLSPRQRLNDVLDVVNRLPMGGTDCALPMIWAEQEGREFDLFVVYTDSETWAGPVHPMEALRSYRQRSGINAKLIVVGMTANDFTIADPADGGALDVVGFDSSAPNLMGAFARGEL